MHKLIVKANANPFEVDGDWGIPIKFNKIRISKLLFTPSTNSTGNIEFKIDTFGKFDRMIDTSTGKRYLFVQPVMKDTAVGLSNQSICNDWDYIETEPKYLTNFNLRFYEDDTFVPTAYLATSPVYLELTFF